MKCTIVIMMTIYIFIDIMQVTVFTSFNIFKINIDNRNEYYGTDKLLCI